MQGQIAPPLICPTLPTFILSLSPSHSTGRYSCAVIDQSYTVPTFIIYPPLNILHPSLSQSRRIRFILHTMWAQPLARAEWVKLTHRGRAQLTVKKKKAEDILRDLLHLNKPDPQLLSRRSVDKICVWVGSRQMHECTKACLRIPKIPKCSTNCSLFCVF